MFVVGDTPLLIASPDCVRTTRIDELVFSEDQWRPHGEFEQFKGTPRTLYVWSESGFVEVLAVRRKLVDTKSMHRFHIGNDYVDGEDLSAMASISLIKDDDLINHLNKLSQRDHWLKSDITTNDAGEWKISPSLLVSSITKIKEYLAKNTHDTSKAGKEFCFGMRLLMRRCGMQNSRSDTIKKQEIAFAGDYVYSLSTSSGSFVVGPGTLSIKQSPTQ